MAMRRRRWKLYERKVGTVSGEASQGCKVALPDILFLGVQYGSYHPAVSDVYIFPYLFGIELAGTEFMWPQIPIHFAGFDYKWNILGYEVARNAAGEVVIGGGLGYFISYELGTFLAQCVNFPLQRNITFKSHGNLAWQILWYFIAWVLISLVCNAVNGLWMPIAQNYFAPAVYNILVTFITGGVSMVIYFFVYKIIFPEGEAKKAE